jgi:TonB family protein
MTTLLLDALVRSTVLLLAGLAAGAMLRHRSSALRHWVLAATIAASALAAPLGWMLPDWSIAAIPARPAPLFEPYAELAISSGSPPASAPARPWSDLFGAIWAAVFGVGALSMLLQLGRLARLSARASRITDSRWLRTVHEVAARYGIRTPVPIFQTRCGDLLATWGFFRPRILVPAGAARWSDQRIRVVVCHELAHVRRHDWALQIAADVVRRVYWFQPLMWIACRQLRRESEHACDDEVLGTGITPDAYAGHLLQIARAGRSEYRWAPAVPMARPSTLERRITAMLNSTRNRRALSHRSLALSTVLLAVATVTAAAFHTVQAGAAPLIGTVYDGSGAVLPGVGVTLSTAQDAKSTATTDAAGRFVFPGTAPGRYAIEVSLPGFAALRQEFELRNSADWDRAITLDVGKLQESVVVRARREPATQPTPGVRAPMPVRVGGNIKVPSKLVNVNPVYPASMRAAGRAGIVPIDAVINTEGSVVFVRVLSANVHPDFAAAAGDAVRQWKFSPTLLNGKPVEVVMSVTVQFTLDE